MESTYCYCQHGAADGCLCVLAHVVKIQFPQTRNLKAPTPLTTWPAIALKDNRTVLTPAPVTLDHLPEQGPGASIQPEALCRSAASDILQHLTGYMPCASLFKILHHHPVLKKTRTTGLNDYRPVSLTSVDTKLYIYIYKTFNNIYLYFIIF